MWRRSDVFPERRSFMGIDEIDEDGVPSLMCTVQYCDFSTHDMQSKRNVLGYQENGTQFIALIL